MPKFAKPALLVLLILIGPLMYAVARMNGLSAAFAKINVGDPASAVLARMGSPQGETHGDRRRRTDVEYRYSVWPLPKVWVVGLKNGQVVEKSELPSS